jgi:hypothetical protein
MHDVDRTQLEYGAEPFEYGEGQGPASEQFEYSGEFGNILGSLFGEAEAEGAFEGGYQEYQGSPLPESMEDELASELLEVGNDEELDHFLGSLFHKVASTVGRVIKSPVGQALGGVLKQVAKKALPIAGGALGTFIGGPAGGMLGSKLASMAGNAFGLELEGLSAEDRDFELAKRYVRLASHAAKKAALAPPHMHPAHVAKSAVADAARKFAPGLLGPLVSAPGRAAAPGAPTSPAMHRPAAPAGYPSIDYSAYSTQPTCPACGVGSARHRRQGKWIRRGRHIVLLGV